MKLVYPVVLYPSGVPGGYTVLCPDMPGLVTEGRNLPEALDMANSRKDATSRTPPTSPT